jgi:hypothetical protein
MRLSEEQIRELKAPKYALCRVCTKRHVKVRER